MGVGVGRSFGEPPRPFMSDYYALKHSVSTAFRQSVTAWTTISRLSDMGFYPGSERM
jgi:hypothetical protein